MLQIRAWDSPRFNFLFVFIMSKQVVKYVAGTLLFGLFTEIVYQIYARLKSKKEKQNHITEVLFFPDLKVACKAHFTSADGCNNRHCRFTHSENSLSRLYNYLTLSRKSLDVCVFVLSCVDLADTIILAHKRGVNVRVITDNEQVNVQGSQIWKLRSEGKYKKQIKIMEGSLLNCYRSQLISLHVQW